MERKLVVGIRDFCILWSWKACLEGNEKEKLTREVLSVLMVAQKSTRRRVEWIKWGLFTVGFFVWSIPHCTVARWLVSSSSVCNPSSDPFVKSHRSPSSFTPCNIFLGISLPKTEQKDHFSCQFFKFQTLKATVVVGSRDQERRSGQSVTASDFGSNGPRFESGPGRCVESLDKALYSHCPKEKPSH